MSCFDTTTLGDHVSGRNALATSLRINQRLAACDRCKETAARLRNARQTLRAVDELMPQNFPAAVSARVEATLRWTRVEATPAPRRWPLFVAAAVPALCALAAFGPLRLGERHPFSRSRNSLALQQPVDAAAITSHSPLATGANATSRSIGAVTTLLGGEVLFTPAPSPADSAGGANTTGPTTSAVSCATPHDASRILHARDQISTGAGARLALQWGEGSGAFLEPNSLLVIDKLEARSQQLSVRRGEIAVRVGPHQEGESMRVASLDHLVTAHGTWFVVGVQPLGTLVQVLEGVVEIGALAGSSEPPTILTAPSRAFFARGHSAGQMERALGGKEADKLRVLTEMGLLPWPVPNAASSVVSTGSAGSIGSLGPFESLGFADSLRFGGPLDGPDEDADVMLLGLSGVLQVQSAPAASLVVDGVSFGVTPLGLRRPRGRHLVELSRPGFEVHREWVFIGELPADLRASLTPDGRLRAPKAEASPPAPGEVQAVVAARSRHVQACYEHSLKRNPNLTGSITLRISVGEEGQVLAVLPQVDTLGDDDVLDCLKREAAGWVFRSARNSTVVYPFVFRAP